MKCIFCGEETVELVFHLCCNARQHKCRKCGASGGFNRDIGQAEAQWLRILRAVESNNDLVETLEDIIPILEANCESFTREEVAQAKAALRKAKGEQ